MNVVNEATQGAAYYQKGMPALYYAADQASMSGQNRFLQLTMTELLLLTAASATATITSRRSGFSFAALVGAAAIGLAGVMRTQNQTANDIASWYQGRAAAESVKTLAWRYAVGGDPFPISLAERDADERFVERLHEVSTDLDGLTIDDAEENDEITSWMRATRGASLAERMQTYEEDRIQDEIAWYSGKAQWNKLQAERWGTGLLVFEAFGLLLGVLRATGVSRGSILGLTATASAGSAAWVQAKDHDMFASAYAVTTRELSAIDSLIDDQKTEEEWANFVANAEDSISREHVLWRASRR